MFLKKKRAKNPTKTDTQLFTKSERLPRPAQCSALSAAVTALATANLRAQHGEPGGPLGPGLSISRFTPRPLPSLIRISLKNAMFALEWKVKLISLLEIRELLLREMKGKKVAQEPWCLRLIPSKRLYSPNCHWTYTGMAAEGLAWVDFTDATLWSPIVLGSGWASPWGGRSPA